jgi:hypothetical protein
MPSITLPQSALLAEDMLLAGVIETAVTVDQFYQILPFKPISGNALAYNRELVVGDSGFFGVGDTITTKAAATFAQVTANLTKIIGDAEVDEMIQATRSGKNDQKATQIASKAKSVARNYAGTLITGDGTSDTFTGLANLVAPAQVVTAATNGAVLSFELLDELLDKVTDKDGVVDFILMNSRELRKYFSILRALGGATIGDVVTLPDGSKVPAYRNTPIFRNNWIPTDGDQGSATGVSANVYAGNLDDGSGEVGISGITAEGSAGIRVQDIGVSETKDETITRVKWYCGLANYSQLGLAQLKGIIPA